MPDEIDIDRLIDTALNETDRKFRSQIASLTTLKMAEVEALINESSITKEDFAKVLGEVKDATKSNTEKAAAIQSISKGVDLLVGIATKLL